MNRRVEIAKLEDGYLVKAWCKTAPEAYAVQCVAQRVAIADAFMPTVGTEQPKSGTAFDPPEVPAWPSDDSTRWYHGPINCDGHNAEAVSSENSAGAVALTPRPNCDGFGDFVMGAQLDDALASEGDGCGIGLCVKRDES